MIFFQTSTIFGNNHVIMVQLQFYYPHAEFHMIYKLNIYKKHKVEVLVE